MKRSLSALLLALTLAACATAPPPQPAAPPTVEAQVAVLKARIFVLIEQERRKLNNQAKPLAIDAELTAAAQVHSEDMARKRSFDAMNPDGNLAVNTLLTDPKFRGYVAENAAAQYFSPGYGFDPDSMARSFVDIWLNSPGHRSNLSYPGFERTGIGVAVNGDTVYATELFATDLGLPEPR
jgi:uncharacterized protein YkwD